MKIINRWMGIALLALTTLFGTNIMAQDLKKPTLEDLLPGGETYRFAETLYGVQWWGDVCIKPGIDSLFTVDPKTGEETFLFTREALNSKLTKYHETKPLNHLYDIKFPWKDKKEALVEVNSYSYSLSNKIIRNHNKETGETTTTKTEKFETFSNTKFFIYDFEKGEVRNMLTITPKNDLIDYSIGGNHAAYTIKNNLFVDSIAVTDEPDGIVCGQSVHRNEFGIHKGTYWSPQGNLLAFYRMDESMVTQYPLVDITERVGELENIRYPMAGMTSHKVTIGIYNPETQKTIYLNAGDPTDRYFTNITWAPDAKSLYLIELNRDQNHAKLCQYNVETGELMATLFEETHSKYVEPQHPIIFLPWDSSKFIYQSQRDGFNHLYLYSTNGKLIKQLTSGNWLVQDFLGFNSGKKEIIIASTEYSPLQSNLFKVSISTGKRTPLGTRDGVHDGVLSESGSYVIDFYSSPEVPRSINLIATQDGKSINLLTAKSPLEGFIMPSIEVGTIKAADGVTDLYYRLVKPADFDPTKKYPAIIYVYGGPHAQMVTGSWLNSARGWDIYMANKGYIMFTLDNRGSDNRGLEFENVTFRNLGIEEGKDQVKGAEFLKSLPYVDGNRIGVHGWSFGGHMTTALMLRYPEIFKVGVAGGPVIDWSYYEIMYGERYMDTPETNWRGYRDTNLKYLADKLKGHLLLIHDDHDNTCVPQHTLSFIKACVDARTYPDLFIYPKHKHNVMGRDRVHLYEKITRYFEEYLR